jgi:translation initiation factor 2D
MRGCNFRCVLYFLQSQDSEADCYKVSPVPGKPANAGLEVLVQGKQAKAVVEYLTGRGIPKKWIEIVDLSGKK